MPRQMPSTGWVQALNQVDQLAFANLIHRRLRGAHARKRVCRRAVQRPGHGLPPAQAVARNRRFDGVQVGASGIQNDHVHYNTPFDEEGRHLLRELPDEGYGQRL